LRAKYKEEIEMKVPFIVGLAAGASLALGSVANADLRDNGDGTSDFYLTFVDGEVVGDGAIYGGVEEHIEWAGSEIVGVGWNDLVVDTGSPFNAYTGDNFWALWLMSGSGGDGWYYGVPFGGESGSTLGPASGGFDLTGAGFSTMADGSFGAGYADVGGSETLDALMNGEIFIRFVGTVPAPGALALIGLAGLAGKSRRR